MIFNVSLTFTCFSHIHSRSAKRNESAGWRKRKLCGFFLLSRGHGCN